MSGDGAIGPWSYTDEEAGRADLGIRTGSGVAYFDKNVDLADIEKLN